MSGIGTMNFGGGMQGVGMQDWQYAGGNLGWIYLGTDGLPTVPPSGSYPPGVTNGAVVQASVNGQPVATGTGHSTRDAIISLVQGLGGQVMTFLNRGQEIKIAQLQYAGQLPGASGATGAGGQGLTGLVGDVTTWMSNNPLLVAAGAVGLFLFLAPSPRGGSRR